ncbi:hypothetical protein NM688_g7598 [Phlebia brevispora]|uniref:Uncharacterized protein n=1 Tax=Phlebia brevispora TaxID=194682 RepID=A0ACC1S3C3_9APHY|nr:hypothetical protein NM688_g7598 [Phlebia brevispora]
MSSIPGAESASSDLDTQTSRPRRVIRLPAKLTDPDNALGYDSNVEKSRAAGERGRVTTRVRTNDESGVSTSVGNIIDEDTANNPDASTVPLLNTEMSTPALTPSSIAIDDDDSEPIAPHKGKRHSRASNASAPSDADMSESDEDNIEVVNPKKQARKKRQSSSKPKDDVNDDGILMDINVQEIEDIQPSVSERRKDIDQFFRPTTDRRGINGRMKPHRQCKLCSTYIVHEATTLRRHLGARYAGAYRKWALENDFQSKLPDDVKKRKEAFNAVKAQQATLDAHLHEMPKKERVYAYTELAFRCAAIEWLIATDQPLDALEHPKYVDMIQTAARATNGVTIPSRKTCRQEIMNMFHEQLAALKKDLSNKSKVSGEISLTCDAWQASNTDGYFAVTAHWIEESRPGDWILRSALVGFTQLNNAHNGQRLGQALYLIADRLDIVDRIGHITCNNASNNGTMLHEFATQVQRKTGKLFDFRKRRINCLAHIINLATQALIAAYSKTPHFDPASPVDHLNIAASDHRDEVGLIRAIAVKERSSAKRKEMFRRIQLKAKVPRPLQLLIDMKVRWSSTYMMLHRAEMSKHHVDVFVYEIAREENNLSKRAKLDNLKLEPEEWTRVTLFLELLGHADKAQQSFSSENISTLHLAIPALEALHKAWLSRADCVKYADFSDALYVATDKISEYYDKTELSDAYIVTMYLVPDADGTKGKHFLKYWSLSLQKKAREHIEMIFEARYKQMYGSSGPAPFAKKSSKLTSLMCELSDDESDAECTSSPLTAVDGKPWLAEFNRYLDTTESIPEGMSVIQWWGRNALRYPVWASLARDYLAIMASSVSSERAFSQAGITISKWRNRLKADVVEALQFLKCMLRNDLIFRAPAPSSVLEQELKSDDLNGNEDSGKKDAEVINLDTDSLVEKDPSSWDIILDSDDEDLYDDN